MPHFNCATVWLSRPDCSRVIISPYHWTKDNHSLRCSKDRHSWDPSSLTPAFPWYNVVERVLLRLLNSSVLSRASEAGRHCGGWLTSPYMTIPFSIKERNIKYFHDSALSRSCELSPCSYLACIGSVPLVSTAKGGLHRPTLWNSISRIWWSTVPLLHTAYSMIARDNYI